MRIPSGGYAYGISANMAQIQQAASSQVYMETEYSA
jgi:hypothetical protein